MDITKINLKKLNKPALLTAALDIQQLLKDTCINVEQTLLNVNLKKMNKKVLYSNASKMQRKLASSKDSQVKDFNIMQTNNINQTDMQQTEHSNPDYNNSRDTQTVSSRDSSAVNSSVDDTEIINDLKCRLDMIEKKLYEAQVRINKFEQYTRRENLEIIGIPDSINQDQLENTVLRILESIGVHTDSYHISACHRLAKNKKQQSANTIIRFTDRKVIYEIFSKKKALKLSPLKEELGSEFYIIENLSPEFKSIFESCKYLKRKNVIHSCWTYNGMVKVKINVNDRPINIFHHDDIGFYIEDAHKFINIY